MAVCWGKLWLHELDSVTVLLQPYRVVQCIWLPLKKHIMKKVDSHFKNKAGEVTEGSNWTVKRELREAKNGKCFHDKEADMLIKTILTGQQTPSEMIIKGHDLRVGFILGPAHQDMCVYVSLVGKV